MRREYGYFSTYLHFQADLVKHSQGFSTSVYSHRSPLLSLSDVGLEICASAAGLDVEEKRLIFEAGSINSRVTISLVKMIHGSHKEILAMDFVWVTVLYTLKLHLIDYTNNAAFRYLEKAASTRGSEGLFPLME